MLFACVKRRRNVCCMNETEGRKRHASRTLAYCVRAAQDEYEYYVRSKSGTRTRTRTLGKASWQPRRMRETENSPMKRLVQSQASLTDQRSMAGWPLWEYSWRNKAEIVVNFVRAPRRNKGQDRVLLRTSVQWFIILHSEFGQAGDNKTQGHGSEGLRECSGRINKTGGGQLTCHDGKIMKWHTPQNV